MRSTRRALSQALLAILVVALGTGCGGASAAVNEKVEPAVLEPIDGTDLYRVVLTESAAIRLDIQTDEVTESDLGLAVPSAALIVDPEGTFWVYTNPEPLAYERAIVNPVREDRGMAYFTNGPPSGTLVVVVGVPELYGAETGVGK